MRTIPLARSTKAAVVDDWHHGWLSQHTWYELRHPNSNRSSYAFRRAKTPNGKATIILMHREIMGLEAHDPRQVDHRDHGGGHLRRPARHRPRPHARAAGRSATRWQEEVRAAPLRTVSIDPGSESDHAQRTEGTPPMSRNSTTTVLQGTQATIRHAGEAIYLGTYATEQEAWFAHCTAAVILGLPAATGKPDLPPDDAARVAAKVQVRLVAHARRTGCPVHSPTLLPLTSQTGFKGVYRMPNPYRAEIRKGRSYFLGTYRTKAEAALAYNETARLLHGTDDLILNDIPNADLPAPDRIEEIRREVRRRLGISAPQPELATAAAQ